MPDTQTPEKHRRWHVRTDTGGFVAGFDEEPYAQHDAASRDARARDLGIVTRYLVVERGATDASDSDEA